MLETYDIVGEGILVVAIISLVEGLREIDFVQQLIIEVDANEFFVPVHAPDVELICPIGILLREMREGNHSRIPNTFPSLWRAPAGIGKNRRLTVLDIILHDVDLAIIRPLPLVAQQPDGRPGT